MKRKRYGKDRSGERKAAALGMPIGTASNRLRKSILFQLVQKLELDFCFHCKQQIILIEDFSIEHKEPWQLSENPIGLFFDLNNIGFSHLSCNAAKAAKLNKIYSSRQDQKRAKDKRGYPKRMAARAAWRASRRAQGLPYT